jgi:hypothetical protein
MEISQYIENGNKITAIMVTVCVDQEMSTPGAQGKDDI